MAASVMPFFIVVCEFFNGILQPVELMPVIWRYTLYYIGPFTYWVSGTISMILLPVSVQCADSEFIRFHIPPNTTCGAYAEDWLSSTTGYLADPDATDTCNYCQYTGGQDVSFLNIGPDLIKFNNFYSISQTSMYLPPMPGHISVFLRSLPSRTTFRSIFGFTSNQSRTGCRGRILAEKRAATSR
jgi:ABC-type multidrug transport system permease subunit